MGAERLFGGHVAHAAVGQLHRAGEGEGGSRLDVEAKLAEVLGGVGQEHRGADLDGLHLDVQHGLLGDEGVEHHDFLGEGPLGAVALGGVLLRELDAALEAFGRGLAAGDAEHLVGGGRRPQVAGLGGDEHLERLGAHAGADEAGGALAELVGVGAQVVHLGHIAAGAVEEHHDGLVAHHAANGLLEVADPVGRRPAGAGGAVAGEVDHAAEQAPVSAEGADHTHLGVGGVGVADDVGVALAGVRVGEAVGHSLAAVEGHLVGVARAHAALGVGAPGVGLHHGGDQGLAHGVEERGVGARRLLVGQGLGQVGGVVVLPWLYHARGAGGVGVGRADHHGVGGDPAFLRDGLARGEHQVARHHQRVQAHQRHPRFSRMAVVEHRRTHLARVMHVAVVERLAVAPGPLHPLLGRDVPFGEACLHDVSPGWMDGRVDEWMAGWLGRNEEPGAPVFHPSTRPLIHSPFRCPANRASPARRRLLR